MNGRSSVRAMKHSFLACVASLLLSAGALADQYPPGPGNCCPDTLTIMNLQNPAASPHLGTGDVVLGVGGVITGFAGQHRPFGFYMQMKNGLPYSGVPVYTGNVNHGPGTGHDLQPGDSVVVYGKVKQYKQAVAIGSLGGNEEIVALSLDSPQDAEDLLVRVVNRGNALPPFHVGSLAELNQSSANVPGRPWRGMLVRIPGPLEVIAVLEEEDASIVTLDGSPGVDRAFLVADPSCHGGICPVVRVDCSTLTSVDPPPVGTILSSLQGIFDRRENHHIVQLRGPEDLVLGNPPLAVDAFPIHDNDLPGVQRVDSVMVVFDRPVEKASAENVANYVLASNGIVDGALRLDAPDDHRVVLRLRNGLDDGVAEAITVAGVKSLQDGTAMTAPQTFAFLNGVLALEKVRVPDANALAGNPCEDRSAFSGAGATPGLRASFRGTVTGAFGDFYVLQGTTPTRGGLWVHAPGIVLTVGRGVQLAGAFQESGGHPQGGGIVYARDLGSAPLPAPAIRSVGVLSDPTCDDTQLFLTGMDLDGMLVTLDRVVVTEALPNGSFYVATPGSGIGGAAARQRAAGTTAAAQVTALGELLVVSQGVPPEVGRIVTVTGALGREAGEFAVFPRDGNDVHDFGPLPTFSVPLNVSKSATQSRDPDIVKGVNGELFMSWSRVFHESVHSLSLDQSQNFSFPLSIMHQGVQPSAAVTPSNKIGVVTSTPEALLYKQSTDGGIQMDPLVTIVDGNPTRYPALTVGSGEHFHAAWERPDLGIYYSRSQTGGDDFSAPIPLATNNDGETNSMVRIGASTGDNVYVFWQYYQFGEPGVSKVLYRRSLDGGTTFAPARQVRDEQNPLTSVVKLAILGDAQVGPDGTVYVMGIQAGGPDDSVAFLKSTNNGQTFVLVGHPSAPAQTGICPKSFAVGADGSIHALIGVCGTALYYTHSPDGGATWGPAVDISSARSGGIGEPRGAKIILDGSGTPVIVWYSQVGGSTEIFSSRQLN